MIIGLQSISIRNNYNCFKSESFVSLWSEEVIKLYSRIFEAYEFQNRYQNNANQLYKISFRSGSNEIIMAENASAAIDQFNNSDIASVHKLSSLYKILLLEQYLTKILVSTNA